MTKKSNNEKTPYSKWNSRKWVLVVWASIIVTLIVIAGLITAFTSADLPEWLGIIGGALCTAIIAYFPSNSLQKKYTNKKENSEESAE